MSPGFGFSPDGVGTSTGVSVLCQTDSWSKQEYPAYYIVGDLPKIVREGVLLRQNEMWQSVITELYRSLYGEQMVCSMSTQLFHIPETKDLKGNAEMHTHLIPASYHRVTATGSAQRLLNGESTPSIVETLITCIQNTEQRDRNVYAGLLVMRDAVPTSCKQFVENIIRWQDYTEFHLQNAKQFAIRITGSTAWQKQSRYGELSRNQYLYRFLKKEKTR